MRNSGSSPRGGAKKFLYNGPKKTTDDDDDEFLWNFNKNTSKDTGQVNVSKPVLDVDEAWNIRRNVNIGPPGKQSDSLTFNVNKNYYSRYGNKEKDELGGLSGGTNTNTDTNQGPTGKSWSMAPADSRRPFSYSVGINLQNGTDKPVSPRNTSNSSFANYTPMGNLNTNNNFRSLSSRESVSSVSKEPLGNVGNNFGTMTSREPKMSHFPSIKTGQSLNSFSNSGNTNSNLGQRQSGQNQSYSNSTFNGSIFSKNKLPW